MRLLPVLLGLYLLAYLDRVNVGIAALQMNADLKFSAATFGFGAGIFFLGYALCEVPSNLILARVGARRWLARIAITWGLLTCAMMFVRTPLQFYSARLLLGVAEAGLFPGVVYYLSHWFPESHRARALSGFIIALPLAQVIGGPLGGALLGLRGALGLSGWQWLFLIEGLPPVMLGAFALVYLTERPEDAHWLSPVQRAWLIERIAGERSRIRGTAVSPVRALANPLAWALAVPYFAYYTVALAGVFWTPTIVRESLHTGDSVTGMVVGGIALVGAITYPIAAILSDRSGERCWVVALGLAFGAAGCIGLALLEHSPLRFVALISIALAGPFVMPSIWCLPTRFLHGPSAAAGIALINAVGSSGGFFGPSIIGFFRTVGGNDAAGFYALACLSLLGAVVSVGLRQMKAFRPMTELATAA
ncbi:MAG TPA: MFS transporter [Candidatus Margulisiibacteriota bacterium]|nr:MFS transporter [Candidatus Margulisiibacteriota bacterium]